MEMMPAYPPTDKPCPFPDLLRMNREERAVYYESVKGFNTAREGDVVLIEAEDDIAALQAFLARVAARSPHTERSYKKELDRFLHWARLIANKSIAQMGVEDLQSYQAFLAEPLLDWMGARLPRAHPHYRPFEKPLSQASVRQALQVLGSLFSFLVDSGYLRSNPVHLIGRKSAHVMGIGSKVERFLERDLWQEFWQFILQQPNESAEECLEYERTRFLFSLLYLQAPRVSEVSGAKMGDFHRLNGAWWWLIRGKGGKVAKVPVHQEMLEALRRYRLSLGLSPLPQIEEDTPLICTLKGLSSLSSDMIYKIVKKYTRLGAEVIGAYLPEAKVVLARASTHWFRHTAITHQAEEGIDIQYLKENARHGSIQTTQRYIHADVRKFHDAMARHGLKGS